MKIIAIDTSGDWGSAALHVDGAVRELGESHRGQHSECILGWIRRLLDEAGIGFAQIDGYAFGAGPGSFTGLRLAAAVTQGLALACDRPVIAVPSLEALAAGCGHPRVLACIDARMNQVYVAAYERVDASWRCVREAEACAPAALPLPAGVWFGAGDGFARYCDSLPHGWQSAIPEFDADARVTAAVVAECALARYVRGDVVDPARVEPLYVRDKVALTQVEQGQRRDRS
ncbi:MAG TPA: tRNA (adenosine(37)-N6)-threonylcarbamoyltransferase complex dimerization subunit type 1 TsaB [Rhodocyclaceae bacterium]|nr:tRNA (adenosine(37)-N6)-threonylcarbamoyltransferase complex dimerization subunit type 1 TsaB [Rhodocyclaceae bacterium]